MSQRTGMRDNAFRKPISWKSCCPGLDRRLTVTAATFFILLSMSCLHCTARSAAGVDGSDEGGPLVRNERRGNESTCFTAACNRTAAMILSNMDSSVEPCDNFYRYACGGYVKSTKFPKGKRRISFYTTAQALLDEQLKAILQAEIVPDEPRAHRLLKTFYRSCMNTSAIVARGLQPLVASLQSIGGWPMIDGAASWNESNFDWIKAIHKLRKAGHDFQDFINIDVMSANHFRKNPIWVKPPSTTNFHNYEDHIVDVAMSLGAPDSMNATHELADTIGFENELNRIKTLYGNSGNVYHIMTLGRLKSDYPSIRWKEYINGILPSTVSIEEKHTVNIKKASYYTELANLMSKTPKRVQANFIAHSMIVRSIDYLGSVMPPKRKRSKAILAGFTEASPREKVCFDSAFSMPFAIASAMNRLSVDGKIKMDSMVHDIRKALAQLFQTASWMDGITKAKALRKLKAITALIAYPDTLSDDKLEKVYENLDMDEDHYYENVHKLSLLNTDYKFSRFRGIPDKWHSFARLHAKARIVYELFANAFVVTPGILQGVFFDEDRPQYMNYGAIGFDIGHEMTHAFDSDGVRIDWKGDRADWLEPSAKREHLKRQKCLVEQYSNYTVQAVGLNVNGDSTKGENMADNGGIKAAYLAYNNWVAKNGVEEKLPGIDMTPSQLFWMSTANVMCSKSSTDFLRDTIHTDRHSPDELRIIGIMSNMPEFAEDFACPTGSSMNPTQRCSFL